MQKQINASQVHSLLSLHIQYRLGLVGQAGADGVPLLHIIVQELRQIEAPQFRGPQALTTSAPEWDKSFPLTVQQPEPIMWSQLTAGQLGNVGAHTDSLCHRGSSGGTKMELSLIRRKKQDAQQCTQYAIICAKEKGRKGTENLLKNTGEASITVAIIVTSLEPTNRDRKEGGLIFNGYLFTLYTLSISKPQNTFFQAVMYTFHINELFWIFSE